jgi:hypothetical protein
VKRTEAAVDLVFLGLTIGFFALAVALVYGCEKLRGRP